MSCFLLAFCGLHLVQLKYWWERGEAGLAPPANICPADFYDWDHEYKWRHTKYLNTTNCTHLPLVTPERESTDRTLVQNLHWDLGSTSTISTSREKSGSSRMIFLKWEKAGWLRRTIWTIPVNIRPAWCCVGLGTGTLGQYWLEGSANFCKCFWKIFSWYRLIGFPLKYF